MMHLLDEHQIETVGLVLAVYNGSEFLPMQLNSIRQQDYVNFKIYCRDDNSCDDSFELLNNFVKKENRAHLLRDEKGNLGARDNFSCLLESSELSPFKYVALSDQDDEWECDKLSAQLALMMNLEADYCNAPILIHSNMTLVDRSLNEIDRSFMRFMGMNHEENALPVLLTQNFVTGCTIMANRRLLEFALPFPDDVLMHDWWLALCAAVFGRIGYISKPLVKYRQHGHNEVGAKHVGDFFNLMTGKWKKRWLEGRGNLFQSMKQAGALAERIRKHDPKNPHLELVKAYASLESLSPLQRVKRINQLGVHAQSKMRQMLLLSRLLWGPSIHNG